MLDGTLKRKMELAAPSHTTKASLWEGGGYSLTAVSHTQVDPSWKAPVHLHFTAYMSGWSPEETGNQETSKQPPEDEQVLPDVILVTLTAECSFITS